MTRYTYNLDDSYEKRKGQIEVQTMHGTPLKTIGLDVPGDFHTKKSEKKYIRKCKRWDYLIVQSKFVADLAPSAFKFENTIMDTGYPRTDILYSSNNGYKNLLTKALFFALLVRNSLTLSVVKYRKSSRIFMQDVVRCLFYMKIMNSRRYVHLVGNIKFLIKNTTRKKEDIDLLLIQKMIFCILLH